MKNFFVAKSGDSESAQRAARGAWRVATRCATGCACHNRINKATAAQGFYALLTFDGVEFSRTIYSAADARRHVVVASASRALTLSRQHFLKRDAVFFNVLVYS